MISDILDLNRIESGVLTPERPIRVRDLLEGARDVTAFETKGRAVSVDAPARDARHGGRVADHARRWST